MSMVGKAYHLPVSWEHAEYVLFLQHSVLRPFLVLEKSLWKNMC